MNTNDVSYWDTAQLRTAASRERAKALRELREGLSAWLHRVRPADAPRTRPCLDAGR